MLLTLLRRLVRAVLRVAFAVCAASALALFAILYRILAIGSAAAGAGYEEALA